MSKKTSISIVMLSLMLIFAGVSCVALSRYVTPAEVDRKAVEYVVSTGIAEPNDFKGYPNVDKAGKLKDGVDSAHEVIQLELEQMKEKDNLEYSIHKDVVTSNYKAGQEREEILFGEKGLVPLGLGMLGFGTLTGFAGLMRKRPGDVTSQDMEQAIAQATGKTADELSEKEKQLVEIVKGVQKFMNTYRDKSPEILSNMKEAFDKTQDVSTQVAVARIKKQIL